MSPLGKQPLGEVPLGGGQDPSDGLPVAPTPAPQAPPKRRLTVLYQRGLNRAWTQHKRGRLVVK